MYVLSHRFLVFNFFIFLFFQVDYYMIYIKWTLCLSKKGEKKKKREKEREKEQNGKIGMFCLKLIPLTNIYVQSLTV